MATATVKSGDFSKGRSKKAAVHKKMAKIHEAEPIPRREYDDFASAIRDVEEGRVSRLEIHAFAEEVKREAHPRAK